MLDPVTTEEYVAAAMKQLEASMAPSPQLTENLARINQLSEPMWKQMEVHRWSFVVNSEFAELSQRISEIASIGTS
jgi:hypothetical protein